jgi:hypothetical protein
MLSRLSHGAVSRLRFAKNPFPISFSRNQRAEMEKWESFAERTAAFGASDRSDKRLCLSVSGRSSLLWIAERPRQRSELSHASAH